jgi:hypothetical protein
VLIRDVASVGEAVPLGRVPSVVGGRVQEQAANPDWPADMFEDSAQHALSGPFSRAAVVASEALGRGVVHDTWYRAMLDAPTTIRPWRPELAWRLWPGATLDAARALGVDEPGVSALRDAWDAVGIAPRRVVDGYVVDWS